MITRFDNSNSWKAADGRILQIRDMETSHIMNTLRLFIRKPYLIMSMIVKDIDETADQQPQCIGPWSKYNCIHELDIKKESMNAVTSLTHDDMTSYALESPLGRAMQDELRSRGVNVDNLLTLWKQEVELNEG